MLGALGSKTPKMGEMALSLEVSRVRLKEKDTVHVPGICQRLDAKVTIKLDLPCTARYEKSVLKSVTNVDKYIARPSL